MQRLMSLCPFESLTGKFCKEQISHKAGMATVALWVYTYGDESVVVPSRDLLRRIRSVLDLSTNVPKHLAQSQWDLEP